MARLHEKLKRSNELTKELMQLDLEIPQLKKDLLTLLLADTKQ
jgi:hypothetical protein